MSGPARAGLLAVARREIAWMWRDKVALLVVVGVPLLAFALLATTFSNAVIRDLRVDVVDQDRSQTSLTFTQAINSAPGVTVSRRSTDLNGAMHAIRAGEALAAVYLPQHLERDILGARRPQLVIFYNKQFFTPGNTASGALQAAVAAAISTLPRVPRQPSFTPGPLVVEQYVLTNPALNFAQFLLRAILPTVLHVVVAIAGGYAVGSEFSQRNMAEWLEEAGGSALTALVGKLMPYLGIFLLVMCVEAGIIHGVFQVQFRGSAVLMGAAASLLIIAYWSLGALLQLLVKNLALGLSLTGIICSPAFGYAGVGFPTLGMSAFALGWGSLLPLRWYIQILFDQAARGVPLANSAEPFMILAALAVVTFGLAAARLRVVARKGVKAPPSIDEVSQGRGLVRAFATEYRRVLGDRGVFGLLVLAPIIYGLFYPQPYLGQLVKDTPIAVVDDDHSDLSRTILQALDADEAIAIATQPSTLAEAHAALARREVFAILSIPVGTEREVWKGEPARLPAFVDSAYFLLFNGTLRGIQESVAAVNADVAARSARPDGSLYRAALSRSSPVEVLNQPLFNPTGGYGSYIVPAAFLLILQQTLLMGAATLGGVAYEGSGPGGRRRRGGATAVIGQALAHLVLVLPGFALYLVVLPRVYGFSATDHVLDLLVLAVPFILSVSFLGQFVGSWFARRETAVLLLIALSLPLFFLVGVAWPPEAIPAALRSASAIFPSTSGIDALVRVNQMGASLADVWQDWQRLWLLTAIYALLAIGAARLAATGTAPHGR